MTPEALRHLAESDFVMGGLIQKIGDCTLKPEPQRTPFESLVRAVAHQQLVEAGAVERGRGDERVHKRGREPPLHVHPA